jgi:hypothetical protein
LSPFPARRCQLQRVARLLECLLLAGIAALQVAVYCAPRAVGTGETGVHGGRGLCLDLGDVRYQLRFRRRAVTVLRPGDAGAAWTRDASLPSWAFAGRDSPSWGAETGSCQSLTLGSL